MSDFDLTGELSLKIELHMLRPITEKVHSGNGPVSLVLCANCDMHTGAKSNFSSFVFNIGPYTEIETLFHSLV